MLGYHVYRAATMAGPFVRLTKAPLKETTFTDSRQPKGPCAYMVRAMKLQQSPSGSYFNLSQGIFCAKPGQS